MSEIGRNLSDVIIDREDQVFDEKYEKLLKENIDQKNQIT